MRSERVAVRRDALAAALVVALGVAGCGGGGGGPDIVLDGSPRIPDDEGVVTALTDDTLELDGERRYDISDDVVVFSSIDLSRQPVVSSLHQYVQVGVDGDDVEWVGNVARPVLTDPPVVVYSGKVDGIEDGRLTFANGTVFRAGPDIDVAADDVVQITIDPESHDVTEVSR